MIMKYQGEFVSVTHDEQRGESLLQHSVAEINETIQTAVKPLSVAGPGMDNMLVRAYAHTMIPGAVQQCMHGHFHPPKVCNDALVYVMLGPYIQRIS
jgi:hypothetical protein